MRAASALYASPERNRRLVRLCVAGAVGGTYGLLTLLLLMRSEPFIQANDFTYPWLAARALWNGHDPYAAVRTATTPWGGGFFYPLPAALVVLPFAWLPAPLAGAIFLACSTALLAFLLTRNSWWPLVVFLSAPAFHAARGVQWSPLLTASAIGTPLLGVVAAKPNMALPLFAFQQSRRSVVVAVVGAGALVAIAFAVDVRWVSSWIRTMLRDPQTDQYRIPLLYSPFGIAFVLAVLRWRRPEARLLLAMACIPQNGFFYEQLPLFLVPACRAEMLVMTIVSDIAYLLANLALAPGGNVPVWSSTYYPFMLIGVYAPALLFVLRRPNEGPVPPWLDRRISHLPAWIRGSS